MSASDFQRSFADTGDVDLVAGSVFGWRFFYPTPRSAYGLDHAYDISPMLAGMMTNWKSTKITARCYAGSYYGIPLNCDCIICSKALSHASSRGHEAPDPDCSCGIYAYWDENYHRHDYTVNASGIEAVIEGSGITLLGTKGFRSYNAQIRGINLEFAEWKMSVNQLAKKYSQFSPTPAFNLMTYGLDSRLNVGNTTTTTNSYSQSRRILSTESHEVAFERYAELLAAYYDVPVYTNSRNKLLEQFPLTKDYVAASE